MINRQSDSVPRSSGGQWTGPWDTVPTGESTVERTVRHHPYQRVNRGADGETPPLPMGVGLSEPPSLRRHENPKA